MQLCNLFLSNLLLYKIVANVVFKLVKCSVRLKWMFLLSGQGEWSESEERRRRWREGRVRRDEQRSQTRTFTLRYTLRTDRRRRDVHSTFTADTSTLQVCSFGHFSGYFSRHFSGHFSRLFSRLFSRDFSRHFSRHFSGYFSGNFTYIFLLITKLRTQVFGKESFQFC